MCRDCATSTDILKAQPRGEQFRIQPALPKPKSKNDIKVDRAASVSSTSLLSRMNEILVVLSQSCCIASLQCVQFGIICIWKSLIFAFGLWALLCWSQLKNICWNISDIFVLLLTSCNPLINTKSNDFDNDVGNWQSWCCELWNVSLGSIWKGNSSSP